MHSIDMQRRSDSFIQQRCGSAGCVGRTLLHELGVPAASREMATSGGQGHVSGAGVLGSRRAGCGRRGIQPEGNEGVSQDDMGSGHSRREQQVQRP